MAALRWCTTARFCAAYRLSSSAEDAGFAQQLLGVVHAGFGQVHLLALLVDPEVALAVFLFLLDQLGHDAVDLARTARATRRPGRR